MMDVTENFEQFSTALGTLVPLFERAGIRWRDEGQYDEFYDIADALFSSFVTSNFVDDERYAAMFQPYRYNMETDGVVRFLVVNAENGEEIGKFRRFVTNSMPFDCLEIDVRGETRTVKFDADKVRVVASDR